VKRERVYADSSLRSEIEDESVRAASNFDYTRVGIDWSIAFKRGPHSFG
jgi:hypothetical protein